ncbi:MAG: energy-coupling factor transporter transmembrane component T family protein [Armatimonadota bacterium]
MNMSLYRHEDSAAHARHPVAKLLALLPLFVLPLVFNDPRWALATVAVCFGIVVAAGALPNLRRIWGLGAILLVMSTLLWTLMLPEREAVWRFGPIYGSPTSLAYGFAMGLRLNGLLMLGVAYVTCTRPEEFTWSLRRIGLPATMTLALSLTFRLVPMFAGTAHTVTQAQMARGLDFRSGGPLARLKRYVPLMVPVLAYAMRSADDLTRALESRGAGAASRGSTEYHEYPWTWGDTALLVLSVALGAACIWLRVSGYGEIVGRL